MEKISVPIPAQVKDFSIARHGDAVCKAVAAKRGSGWQIASVDKAARMIHLTRGRDVIEVSGRTVSVPAGTKPTDGDKIAQQLADQYPGYYMTSFEPYLGRAEICQLSDDVARARGAVATALGVKPWEVSVAERPKGGYLIKLPRIYMPSKHDEKLYEVATLVVGRPGWYVETDPNALTAQIIPADLPTFAGSVEYPSGEATIDSTPLGQSLASPGQKTGANVSVEWNASAFMLLAGTPGSGKSNTLNHMITSALTCGMELVIVDTPMKAVDFDWCKDLCRPGGWGCDSGKAAATALALMYEEGTKRAEILRKKGVKNWLDLPPTERFKPILAVVDEMSGLVVPEPLPKGLPASSPLRKEVVEINTEKATISSYVRKIMAEGRFVGLRMIISTQATNANTGVPPSLRTLMGNVALQGVKPSKSARAQIFTNEPAMPQVPANVAEDGLAGRGVGVAQLEGQPPVVYKSIFAQTDQLRKLIDASNPPRCSNPSPTKAQIAQVFEVDEEGGSSKNDGYQGERAPSGKPAVQIAKEMGDDLGYKIATGAFGTGYEKANAMRHLAANGGNE